MSLVEDIQLEPESVEQDTKHFTLTKERISVEANISCKVDHLKTDDNAPKTYEGLQKCRGQPKSISLTPTVGALSPKYSTFSK